MGVFTSRLARLVSLLSRIRFVEMTISKLSGVFLSRVAREPTGDVYRKGNAESYHMRHQEQDWWHVENRVLGELVSTLPRGISVLDVPFGTGRFMPFYLDRDFRVTGADVSEDMFQAAAAIWGEDLSIVETDIANVMSLPYPANTFDLVVCFRMLQMVLSYADALVAIEELVRVSRKHIIVELNFRSDNRVINGLLNPERPMANFLGKNQLTELLSKFGVDVKEVRGPLKGSERKGHYAILLEKHSE